MDDELKKAFAELQIKAVDTAQRVQQTENEIETCRRAKQHALLTERELSTLPEVTRTYESFGAFYLLEPLQRVRESLLAKAEEKDEKIKSLEAHKEYLNKSVKEDEDNLRELLMQKQGRT
ncbi:prefoldin subunit 1-like [Corticium candelabrum]|uniref:prefoldin subunit 1-like n=1 Tax=Corticium candelabrum TaxID=121492 RepID=UPI002E2576E2|nr:prefoldin subunit 1-like [Corticium candelabrum]